MKYCKMNLRCCKLVLALVALAGCTNDDFVDQQEGLGSIDTIKAVIEDKAVTRTHFSDELNVAWDEGDEITVISDAESSPNTFTYQSGDSKAVFKGNPVSMKKSIYAFYAGNVSARFDVENKKAMVTTDTQQVFEVGDSPDWVPMIVHDGSETGYAGRVPMAGKSQTTDMTFKQVVGIVKISITAPGKMLVGRIGLRSNAGEKIAGTGYIDLTADEPVLVIDQENEENSDVIYMYPNVYLQADVPTAFYFQLPPMTLEEGFTVTVLGSDMEDRGLSSFTIEKVSNGPLTISRASLKPFAVAEYEETIQEGDIENALTKAYATFFMGQESQWGSGCSFLNNYVFGDVAGGDANKGSQAGDQPDFEMISTYSWDGGNSYLYTKWQAVYEAARLANKVIHMVVKAPDLVDNPDVIIAQAKFIKAVWMFEGIRMFGAAIPYESVEDYEAALLANATEMNYYYNTQTEVLGPYPGYQWSYSPVVSNVDESGHYIYIWDRVEQDFKDAIVKLPATWDAGNEGRATSWMAKAMLAKLYLYWSSPYNGTNGVSYHLADAKVYLDDIINNGVNAQGKKFALANKYSDLFDVNSTEGSVESVFDIQLNYGYYTGLVTNGGWGFYQPTYEFVNSFMVDENGLPIADYTDYGPLTSLQTDDYGYSDFETDLSIAVDPRLDFCAGRIGVPYWDLGLPTIRWVRSYTNAGPYLNKKFQKKTATYFYTDQSSAVKQYHVVRFADILLMRAECAIEEGDLATANRLINQVRARAANDFVENEGTNWKMDNLVNGTTLDNAAGTYRIGLYPLFSSSDEARSALEREMRAEFGMEGHRWFDLARWGTAATVLNSFRTFENQCLDLLKYNTTYGDNWVTFPIPTVPIATADGRIVQNTNWK